MQCATSLIFLKCSAFLCTLSGAGEFKAEPPVAGADPTFEFACRGAFKNDSPFDSVLVTLEADVVEAVEEVDVTDAGDTALPALPALPALLGPFGPGFDAAAGEAPMVPAQYPPLLRQHPNTTMSLQMNHTTSQHPTSSTQPAQCICTVRAITLLGPVIC
jgi:hypothetical protein